MTALSSHPIRSGGHTSQSGLERLECRSHEGHYDARFGTIDARVGELLQERA